MSSERPRRWGNAGWRKRLLVAVLSGLLLLDGSAPAQAACGVYLSAGSWLSGLGTTVYSNCYQCTDLAERQYDATGWLEGHNFRQIAPTWGAESMIYADGSGWHVRTDVPVSTLSAYSGNGSYTPIPGDLVIMGTDWPAGGGAGHVAVVETVSGSSFGVVEQNPGGRATYTKNGSGWTRSGYTAKGFIHSSRNALGGICQVK